MNQQKFLGKSFCLGIAPVQAPEIYFSFTPTDRKANKSKAITTFFEQIFQSSLTLS